ncbi:MAG: hypothetical protein QCI82_11415 [Candidatus Thermoplasmatota archaeon]|nr:hypothetical protein [Candidatus Thermoplasmatota archaeon]
MKVPNISAIEDISLQATSIPLGEIMTSIDCLTRICESPDVSCPTCSRNMSMWVWKENIIYRCDECNAIGFKVSDEQMKGLVENTNPYRGRTSIDCSECGKRMEFSVLDEWIVARCSDCRNIFAVFDERNEPPEMEDVEGSRVISVLNWIGGVYDRMTSL